MKNLNRIILILLVILSSLLFAQEGTFSFSLEEAQKYALDNNYDVKNARLNIDVAKMQQWEVTATGFPQVSVSAQYQKLLDIPTQLIPGEIFGGAAGSTIPVKFGKPHNATYGISASQLIFNGSYIVGLQASRIYKQLSEKSLARTELDVKETIAQTYFLVLMAEENVAILKESLQNLEKIHYEISEMHKEGFVEETDVKQLQISVSELRNTLTSIEQQTEVAYNLLKMQMGIEFDQSIQLEDGLAEIVAAIDVDSQLDRNFDLNNNITYQLLQTQEKLADLSYKNELATFLPSLAAFASAQKNAQRDEFNLFDKDEKWYPTTVVGVQLNWPIFSGGGKIFRAQKAKLELRQTTIQKQQAAQGLMLDYSKTRSELESNYKRYRVALENKLLAREVHETNQVKFMEGLISSMDLVQSHNQYLKAETDYLGVAGELMNSNEKMKKLLSK